MDKLVNNFNLPSLAVHWAGGSGDTLFAVPALPRLALVLPTIPTGRLSLPVITIRFVDGMNIVVTDMLDGLMLRTK